MGVGCWILPTVDGGLPTGDYLLLDSSKSCQLPSKAVLLKYNSLPFNSLRGLSALLAGILQIRDFVSALVLFPFQAPDSFIFQELNEIHADNEN